MTELTQLFVLINLVALLVSFLTRRAEFLIVSVVLTFCFFFVYAASLAAMQQANIPLS